MDTSKVISIIAGTAWTLPRLILTKTQFLPIWKLTHLISFRWFLLHLGRGYEVTFDTDNTKRLRQLRTQ